MQQGDELHMISNVSETVADWVVPCIIVAILTVGYWRKVKIYEVFVEGAADGFQTTIKLMPFLLAMMVAISVFRASGALEACTNLLEPILSYFSIPSELFMLAIIRPLSGSGSLGIVTDIINTYGPDSFLGKVAATILGSTDTTFYILTVYLGAIGVTNPRYSVIVGLIGNVVGFLASIYICKKLFISQIEYHFLFV